MVSEEERAVICRAEAIYYDRLKDELERTHRDWFVAIEPDSGDHFVDRTFYEAAQAAQRAHPGKLPHVMRVGHPVAVEIGNSPL